MEKAWSHTKQKGFSLAEILVAVAVFLVFVNALMTISVRVGREVHNSNNKERAIALAEEALEAARNLRDEDFANLTDGKHGISVSSNRYSFAGSSDVIDIFTRQIVVETTGDHEKRFDVTVSWADQLSPSNSVVVTTYVTNWRAVLANAGLTVNKTVINHGGTKTVNDFGPFLAGTTTMTIGQANLLYPGAYNITETTNSAYTQTFTGDCSSTGSVTIVNGDAKICTITNEEKPSRLTVTKVVVNTSQNKTVADFPLFVDSVPVTSGNTNTFDSGTHTVSETNTAGYTAVFSGDCNASGVVTLVPGTTKTCTITNTEPAVTQLTVNKVVINHGSSRTTSSFAPYKVGTTTVNVGQATVFTPGTYTVTETSDSVYTQTFSGDCNASGVVTLAAGDNKTCTITNEEKSIGVIVYGNLLTAPSYRNYYATPNVFDSPSLTTAGGLGASFAMESSPTRREMIAGYVTSTGVLQIMCYDGENWTDDWSVTVGGLGTTRRFDIAYETATGDVMVLFSRNVLTSNELGYRTKAGSTGCGSANWSAATNLDPVRTSGGVHWIKMASDRRVSSNLIAATWADSNSDLSVMIWTGTAWTNEPTAATETSLEVVTTAQDVDDFDIEYESLSGEVVLVWANSAGKDGTNGVRYRTCSGGTASCTWNAVTTPPTFSDDATNLDISPNPLTDELVFASIGNAASDLQIGYWSGSAWTNTANVDTSANTPVAGSRLVATGWLSSGGTNRSVIVYNDSAATNIGWYVGNGSTFTLQTDFNPTPAFASGQRWYDIKVDPINKNNLMFTVSAPLNNIFAKRLAMTSTPAFTWTNSDSGAAINANLLQLISSPFAFEYWKQ